MRTFGIGLSITILFLNMYWKLDASLLNIPLFTYLLPVIFYWFWWKKWVRVPHWTIWGLGFIIGVISLQSWHAFWSAWISIPILLFFGAMKPIYYKDWRFWSPLAAFLGLNLTFYFMGDTPDSYSRFSGLVGSYTILGTLAALVFICAPWYWSILLSLPCIALAGTRAALVLLGVSSIWQGKMKLVLALGMLVAALLFIPSYMDNTQAHAQSKKAGYGDIVYNPGHRILDEGIEQKLDEIIYSFSQTELIGKGWNTMRFSRPTLWPHSAWVVILEELGWIFGFITLVLIFSRLRGLMGAFVLIFGLIEFQLWGLGFGLAILGLTLGQSWKEEKDESITYSANSIPIPTG